MEKSNQTNKESIQSHSGTESSGNQTTQDIISGRKSEQTKAGFGSDSNPPNNTSNSSSKNPPAKEDSQSFENQSLDSKIYQSPSFWESFKSGFGNLKNNTHEFIKKIPILGAIWVFLLAILFTILRMFGRFLIPLLLIILILIPVYLTFFAPSNKPLPAKAETAKIQTLTKSLRQTGTIDYDYAYDLSVYQDSILEEVLVKEGDQVEEGQVLAKLKFVNENTIRVTSVENQLRSIEQELKNNQKERQNLLAIDQATKSKMEFEMVLRNQEMEELRLKIDDKRNLNDIKKKRYQKEIADLQNTANRIANIKDINDAIIQYNDKINALEQQQNTYENNTSVDALAYQVIAQTANSNNLNTAVTTAQTALTTALNNQTTVCTATPLPDPACQTAIDDYNAALATYNQAVATYNTSLSQLNNLNNQLAKARDANEYNLKYIDDQIDDLRAKRNSLYSESEYIQNQPLAPSGITQAAKNSRLEKQKSEVEAEIKEKKTNLKALEDDKEISTLYDQFQAKKRAIEELGANQNLSQKNLEQTLSGNEQRRDSTRVNLENTKKTLEDTLEDIKKQQENKEIVAKKAGKVGKIYKQKGMPLGARDAAFRIISSDFRIKVVVSAGSRTELKTGLEMRFPEKYKYLKNVKLDQLDLVPIQNNSATGNASTDLEYNVYGTMPNKDPNSKDIFYIPGENVDTEIVIEEKQSVLSVPSTAVSKADNKTRVYLAKNQYQEGNKTYYSQIGEMEVSVGLEDGKNTEIISGLKEGDLVFPIFPRNQKDKDDILNAYIKK